MLVLIRSRLKKYVIAVVQMWFSVTLGFLS
jgi:hypothetical protein